MPAYLDTSAFIKLVRSEPESGALREELRRPGTKPISSVLLSVEARRAARRYGALASARTEAALATVTLLALDEEIIDIAADLEPVELRSLDALHLATMLSVGGELRSLYCYDARLAAAARSMGVEVAEPR